MDRDGRPGHAGVVASVVSGCTMCESTRRRLGALTPSSVSVALVASAGMTTADEVAVHKPPPQVPQPPVAMDPAMVPLPAESSIRPPADRTLGSSLAALLKKTHITQKRIARPGPIIATNKVVNLSKRRRSVNPKTIPTSSSFPASDQFYSALEEIL